MNEPMGIAPEVLLGGAVVATLVLFALVVLVFRGGSKDDAPE